MIKQTNDYMNFQEAGGPRRCLFKQYFIIYNKVFTSQIGTTPIVLVV